MPRAIFTNRTPERRRRGTSTFAIIPLRGLIVDEAKQSFAARNGVQTSADSIEHIVEHLLADEDLRGVMLRVNSPGGLASASEKVFADLSRLRSLVPVVAAIDGVGASGAYMAALAADVIVASPASLVGSIGVIMELPDVSRGLERIGVRVDLMTSGEFKGAGAPFRERTERERAYFQHLIDCMHERFVAIVDSRRVLPARTRNEAFSGKVFPPEEAKRLGLIDDVCDVNTAKRTLFRMARERFPDITMEHSVWKAARQKRSLLQQLLDDVVGGHSLSASLAAALPLPLPTGCWYLWRP